MTPLKRIRDAAAAIGVSPGTLLRYERLGLIPKPARNPGNQRVYNDQDLETIRRVIAPERAENGT